jgi:hypothetical protein
MATVQGVAGAIAAGSFGLGLGGASVVVWLHPEGRLPVSGVSFLLACLAVGAAAALVFAAVTSWALADTPAAAPTAAPDGEQAMPSAPSQALSARVNVMRTLGGVLGVAGGLGLMYFGIHQTIGKVPFPFAAESAAKIMSAVCGLVACVGVLLVSRSRTKAAGPRSDETKPNPDR